MLSLTNIWVESKNLIDHYNILGEKIKFYYYKREPRLAIVEDNQINTFINYFLDLSYFEQPPSWIIYLNAGKIEFYQYENESYQKVKFEPSLEYMLNSSTRILLTPKAAKVVLNQIYNINNNWLSNSLSRVAIKTIPRIFSEQETLVYELIQNSFDSDACKVFIDLTPETLNFYHDGIPFTESDVQSISFVNLSTKGKDKVGFMGIGFKSVFLASDKPEIHSYPFSFQFNCKENQFGFILPQFMHLKEIENRYTTLISVPLKDEGVYKNLNLSLLPYKENNDSGLSSKTFLHLVKNEQGGLRGITFIKTPYMEVTLNNRFFTETIEMETVINGIKEKELWLRLESTVSPTIEEINDFLETRQIQVDESWDETVSIGIKLVKNDNLYSPLDDFKGIVNVYLPTKINTGLQFDLQGNFLVNASREGLKSMNGLWNSRLFGQLSNLLIGLLRWCKKNTISGQLDIAKFYNLIPDWDKTIFNEEIIRGIQQGFMDEFVKEPLVPVEMETGKIGYCFPDECIIVDQKLVELLGVKIIEEYKGKKVVIQGIDKNSLTFLADTFEIDSWGIHDTMHFFINERWHQGLSELEKLKDWNIWLTDLYSYLYNTVSFGWYEDLKECRIYPVSWDKNKKAFKFSAGNEVYRLMNDNSSLITDVIKENDILIFHASFENFISGRAGNKDEDIDKEKLKDARGLLDTIKIKKLDPATVIQDFIIPIFLKVHKYKTEEILTYTAYICRHFSEVKGKKQVIKNILLLNKEGGYCKPTALFFGKEFRHGDLETFFASKNIKQLFVSDQYLQFNENLDWYGMFKSMGVHTLLPIIGYTTDLRYYSSEGRTLNERLNLGIPRTGGINGIPGDSYVYVNYDFKPVVKERLTEVLENSYVNKSSLTAYLRILEENWKYYSDNIFCKVKYFRYKQPVFSGEKPIVVKDTVHTTFYAFLQQEEWVPVKNNDKLHKSSEVYISSQENKDYIRNLLVCENEVTNEDFIKDLRFKVFEGEISHIDRLQALKANGITDITRYSEIYNDIVGEYRIGKLSKIDIKSFFENNNVIYGKGKFWSSNQLLIYPTVAMQDYLPDLKEEYPDLDIHFLDILEIAESEPSISIIREFFIHYLWKTDRGMSDEYRNSILYGYRRLVNYLNDDELDKDLDSEEWKEFREKAQVFCKNNQGWVKVQSDKPILYLDRGKYEKKYNASGKVYIESHIHQLKRDTEDLVPLLKLFNIYSESLSVVEKDQAFFTGELYTNQAIVIKHLKDLYQVMLNITNWIDIDTKEAEIAHFKKRIKHLYDAEYLIYKANQIKSKLILKGEELLELERNCMIEKLGESYHIYTVDHIKIIYGSIKEELLALLDINNLPLELKNHIVNIVANTVANIEDEYFQSSINRYLKEVGYVTETVNNTSGTMDESRIPIELVSEKEEKGNRAVEEEKTLPGSTIEPDNSNQNQGTPSIKEAEKNKKPYEEIVEELDLEDIEIIDDTSEGSPQSGENEDLKRNGNKRGSQSYRSGSSFPHNKYSDDDGQRGEKVVLDLEIKRLMKSGLVEYIDKVYHVAKDKKGNPWDIESFNKTEDGEVIPIRIEVKATTESENIPFPMSINEFQEAMKETHEKGDLYIYRVLNVRSAKPTVERYQFKELVKKNRIRVKSKDIFVEIV